jgi:hypothetical protein
VEGSFGLLKPDTFRLLALQPLASGELRLRAQNRGARAAVGQFILGQKKYDLGNLGVQQIGTWTIEPPKS